MTKLWTGTGAGGRYREVDGRKVFYIRERLGDGLRREFASEVHGTAIEKECAH